MRFGKYLVERRMKSERIIMYHGTSSKFLRTIKSQGLKINPKEKKWDIDQYSDINQPTRASLEGAYLTANLMTATSAAGNSVRKFGGNTIVVCVLFQPRSGLPDEDSVRYTLGHAVQKTLGISSLDNNRYNETTLAVLLFDLKNIECDKKCLTNRFIEVLKSYGEINERALKPEDAENFLKAEMMRRVSHYWKNEKAWYIFSGFEDIMPPIPYKDRNKYSVEEEDKIREKWKKKIKDKILSPQEADKEYLKQLDIMTRKAFKGLRTDTSDFQFNVRAMKNVNYKGRNKIISIVEIIEPKYIEGKGREDKPVILKVHYGSIPNDFIKQYKEKMGYKFEIK